MKPEALNTIRLLTKHKISHTIHQFPDTIHNAQTVAAQIGQPANLVYKTLVVLSPEKRAKPLLVMVAAPDQLNLKSLAKSLGVKKLNMAPHAQAEKLTRLQVGGISALALLNKGFGIYLSDTAKNLQTIVISAGKRGVNVELAVTDLLEISNAKFVFCT